MRYGRRFLATTEDIEDMVQEVFIKAYTKLQSYDTSRPFSPWLYRIAHNQFVNELRRQSRQPWSVFDADTIFPTLAAPETTDRESLVADLSGELAAAVATLKPKHREPLVLFFYEELSYAEIADVLRIPVTTVGVRINRAKAQLRNAQLTNTAV
jgi:RNA polymerase sigma-70 factor (ECF subfamily)